MNNNVTQTKEELLNSLTSEDLLKLSELVRCKDFPKLLELLKSGKLLELIKVVSENRFVNDEIFKHKMRKLTEKKWTPEEIKKVQESLTEKEIEQIKTANHFFTPEEMKKIQEGLTEEEIKQMLNGSIKDSFNKFVKNTKTENNTGNNNLKK